MDPAVLVAIIAGLFGVVTTWLTVKYKDKVIKKAERPKDRMETIFDGYEKLILQQQVEIERKSEMITSLESIIGRLQDEVTRTQGLLSAAQSELKETEANNATLKRQLEQMRRDYQKTQQ